MQNIQLVQLHLFSTWLGFLAGVLSGAVVGVFFHREDWLGGYSSYSRRLLRLGHISLFGLGLLNALFAVTLAFTPVSEFIARIASIGLMVGTITMPLCCFLSAWRKSFRCLFPIPVGSLLVGTALVLLTLARS
jgi:hypothetical protein